MREGALAATSNPNDEVNSVGRGCSGRCCSLNKLIDEIHPGAREATPLWIPVRTGSVLQEIQVRTFPSFDVYDKNPIMRTQLRLCDILLTLGGQLAEHQLIYDLSLKLTIASSSERSSLWNESKHELGNFVLPLQSPCSRRQVSQRFAPVCEIFPRTSNQPGELVTPPDSPVL